MKRLILCLFLLISAGMYSCSKNQEKPSPEEVVPDTIVNTGTNPATKPPANPPVSPPVTPPADPPGGSVGEVSGSISPVNILSLITANLVNKETNVKIPVTVSSTGIYKVFATKAGSYDFQISLNSDGKIIATMSLYLKLGSIEHISFSLEGHPSLPKPVGTSGIKGKVGPVASTATIGATNSATNVSYEGTINSNGEFEFKNLPAGDYTVGVNPGAGYTPVISRSVKVTVPAGETVTGVTIAFYVDSDPGTPNYISYNQDGTVYHRKAKVGIDYASPKFRLFTSNSGGSSSGFDTRISVIIDQLELILDDVTGPGTYVCKGTTGSTIRVTKRDFAGISGYSRTARTWTTIGTGGSGTVTITSIDPATRTMSGTFSATLVPENYATGNKQITSGAFANFKY